MNERSGFPSMTALLGLLAIAGYQNRDKIAEMLKNVTGGAGSAPGTGNTTALPGGLGGLLAGTSVGGLLTNGLSEMMEKFNQAGHKDTVDSWVGTGPNKDVAPTDLKNALGTDVISALARATGMSEQDLLAKLSRELPQAVDKYTPTGRIASA
ncbi:MAG: YidB family protein [Pseudorhodoplanes sp.]